MWRFSGARWSAFVYTKGILLGVGSQQFFESIREFLAAGSVPMSWTDGVVAHIVNDSGLPVVTRLRPITRQTTRQKWHTNTILLYLNDVLGQCVHMQQTGFIKGHPIFKNIFSFRSLWKDVVEGAVVSIDSANAFPTLSHRFCEAILVQSSLPHPLVRLIL